ncbi:putative leucine-rich repeat-containing, plant-type, leucine-rich repeat domain superfamily [Helianthus annuus]|uniref:Leucine-rich repeat-containing, plant-type, leucine-rich repeat domain superfamily n=1 Tax=Helianthus annuus TaxID=4232 RepID=A0A9K3DKJ6_HELAN|nr:putative leucine-rich repeat-containing, plant-type, leucine-rich repeat domain superfamily [Helianthus annuus]KAJ0449102.1 putative leucine-rich repeat-containing, plant-type, leucine-rich repeat domain superfamily [Helianthus annuus]KAJ0637772.1 putative leucine-rich repeat-containing, plant-type, leucine-rich repeat domain superfamily [Helianthus annuus]KAJ0828199.1 putative leucine-rich repeat-containing, plant-type, leucine-rich repeat domain superfamily [Helianthus annuus]
MIQYASCELPSFQLTTMNTLLQLLQTNNHNSKWNSSSQDLANPCSWTGVLCNPNNSFITELSLSSFSLFDISNDYSWSSLVCGIETLEKLDVSNNQLAAIAGEIGTTSLVKSRRLSRKSLLCLERSQMKLVVYIFL